MQDKVNEPDRGYWPREFMSKRICGFFGQARFARQGFELEILPYFSTTTKPAKGPGAA